MKDFWMVEASGILKSLLARESMTYKALALRLERMGLVVNPRQLRNKINRGTFSFTFFLQCLHVLGHTEGNFHLKAPPQPALKPKPSRNA